MEIDVVDIDGLELLLVSWDVGPANAVAMTPAEEDVARAIVAGASNAEIARSRATSTRTVANQVAALLRKFGVGSRLALVYALSRAAGPVER